MSGNRFLVDARGRERVGALDRLAALAGRRGGLVIAAGWAFLEAVVLPVVPDVALDAMALANPRATPRLFLAGVLGSIAGTVILFAFAVAEPAAARDLLILVPGIDAAMLESAAASVAGGNPAALALFGPGTPLKAYTVAWALGPGSPLPLVLGVVINRLTRIGPALLAAAVLGWLAPAWLRRHERLVLATYGAGWIALYVLYLGT